MDQGRAGSLRAALNARRVLARELGDGHGVAVGSSSRRPAVAARRRRRARWSGCPAGHNARNFPPALSSSMVWSRLSTVQPAGSPATRRRCVAGDTRSGSLCAVVADAFLLLLAGHQPELVLVEPSCSCRGPIRPSALRPCSPSVPSDLLLHGWRMTRASPPCSSNRGVTDAIGPAGAPTREPHRHRPRQGLSLARPLIAAILVRRRAGWTDRIGHATIAAAWSG